MEDHQGSVREIVRSSGTTIEDTQHIRYDAFGNLTTDNGEDPWTRFTYTGQEFDPETGLYFYGARYYDPGTGRFISEDPLSFAAGDANLYRYVGNNPVTFVDPTGLAAPLCVLVRPSGLGPGVTQERLLHQPPPRPSPGCRL